MLKNVVSLQVFTVQLPVLPGPHQVVAILLLTLGLPKAWKVLLKHFSNYFKQWLFFTKPSFIQGKPVNITLHTGIGMHSTPVPGPKLVCFDTSGFAEEPPTLSAITSYLKIYWEPCVLKSKYRIHYGTHTAFYNYIIWKFPQGIAYFHDYVNDYQYGIFY